MMQPVHGGATQVVTIPAPIPSPNEVLAVAATSLISSGTERYVVDLARMTLLAKARARPDHVQRVLQKIREEGLLATLRQVRGKLNEVMPLGYSMAGEVLECGRGVRAFKPGDRVAMAAPHAELAVAGQTLCAIVPKGVSFEQAAYTSVAAIGLQGVRLARVSIGESILVIGLGLIGQVTACLLQAQGCRVFGIDPDESRVALAKSLTRAVVRTDASIEEIRAFSGASGVDAVIITASTTSNAPIELAAEACRAKGRVVLVGVTGMSLPREPFYRKELEFTVSSSLGPGRGDRLYEEKGIDYPLGYARWTAQRNMQAVLELMADGRLPVEKLTTHRFPVDKAPEAYQLVSSGTAPHLGILLEYPSSPSLDRLISTQKRLNTRKGDLGISVIGAGNYSRLILLPRLAHLPGTNLRILCSARGLNAQHEGLKYGFAGVATDVDHVLRDELTDALIITTRHDSHAELVIRGLRAGKHVFVEKPMCITADELTAIESCIAELGNQCPVLTVGFNRRFAPATIQVLRFFEGAQPRAVNFRMSPGPLPAEAWPQDEEVGGGRIVGEACHGIDVCAALAESPPVRVFAESVAPTAGLDVSDDQVVIAMRHANGSISSVSYQAGGDRACPPERIEVFGHNRTAIIQAWDTVELWNAGRLSKGRGAKNKGHVDLLRHFVRACLGESDWPIPWGHLQAVSWASIMAVRSLREGYPFSIHGENR